MSFFRKPESRFVVIVRGVGTRQSLAPDTFETTFLSVCRYFFESFQKPESQCWMNAFMEAERRFPPPFGATLAHAITIALKELRTARQISFSYHKQGSLAAEKAVTDDERYLVLTLRAIREGRLSEARSNAIMLCAGGESKGLLSALERICVLIGEIEDLRFQG